MRLALILAGLCAVPTLALAEDLKVGQTLACPTADPADSITVVVGSVETMGGDTVIGVSLYNHPAKGEAYDMAHLPIEQGALRAGCPRDAAEPMPLNPDFQKGYALWREAVERGHAGFFTIPIDRVIDAVRGQFPPKGEPQ